MELSNKEWQPFFLSSIFPEPKRGKRIVNENHIQGDTPLVSSAGDNNGVTAFIGNKEKVRIYNNCLSIANGGSSAGKCFYEPFEFVASDHITHCRNEKLTENQYLAVASLITAKLTEKYSFCREITDLRISREKIMLPVNDAGEPDLEYLEQYVKELKKSLIEKYLEYAKQEIKDISYVEVPKLNEKEWKDFPFVEIFKIKGGFYNKKPPEEKNGTIPFIGATECNNGITEFYTLDNIESHSKTGDLPNEDLDRKIFAGNCICVTNNGSVGYAYYQANQFTCSHDVNPLYANGYIMNKWIAQFLVGAIEKQKVCFTYVRKWRPKRMVKSRILLPVNSLGNPDYEYMEQYIKNLMIKKYSDYIAYAEK